MRFTWCSSVRGVFLALAIALTVVPSVGRADDDNDAKRQKKHKQEISQQTLASTVEANPSGAPVACCLPPVSSTAERDSRLVTTNTHVVVTGNRVVNVIAHPTGNGPADQAECDNLAGVINQLSWELEEALLEDDQEGVDAATTGLELVEGRAESRGCAIIN